MSLFPIGQPKAFSSSDLGAKLAENVVNAILGEAGNKIMGEIFGTGPKPLTKEEVADIINSAFEKATSQDITEKRIALANKIRLYKSGNYDQAWEIMNDAGDLQALVESHISKGNSTVAIPAYVAAWNARLAFAAEAYRITQDPHDKHQVAIEALHGLTYLNSYLREDFRDTIRGSNPCIQKSPATKLRLNGAVGYNLSEKDVDISTQYCYGNGRVVKTQQGAAMAKAYHHASDSQVVNLGGAWYMRTTDMGKALHEDLWLFAGRKSSTGNEYFLEQSRSEEYAYIRRNQYIINHYPQELGNLHNNILGWVDIVKATQNTATSQFDSALKYAIKLGVGWNTLKQRYPNSDVHNISAFALGSFESRGETRPILD